MNINNQDFEQIKAELITLFHMARKQGDIYVMEEAGYLVEKLQAIEIKNLRKKAQLKAREYAANDILLLKEMMKA